MRPVHLQMTAFGPFVGQEVIDFTRLGSHPLFLINGPTGAGKTTLLDAICFALYGKSTGDEREGSQMRCDMAAPESLSVVVLTVELGGILYRIRRIPEQLRPKSRGEGLTSQSAEAQLWRLDPEGREQLLVPAKVSEATAEIERLTGLNADQFRQVMVLPQGKFRQLLMAESKQREQIFSQLFQTRIYRRLEERLKQDASSVRREVEDQQRIRQGMLEGAGVAEGGITALQATLQRLRPERDLAQTRRAGCAAQVQTLTTSLAQARELRERFTRLAQAQSELQTLQQQQGLFDAKRTRIEQAERAAQLDPLALACQQGRDEASTVNNRLQQLQAEEAQARQTWQQSQQAYQRLAELEKQRDIESLDLERLQGLAERVKGLRLAQDTQRRSAQEQQAAAQAMTQAEQAHRQLGDQFRALEQRQTERWNRLQQSREQPLNLQRCEAQTGLRRDLAQLQAQIEQQQKALSASEVVGLNLKENYRRCQQAARQCELQWHQGQAALLAQSLEQDQPCPVCGSAQHPSPAQLGVDIPDAPTLERVRLAEQEALEQLNSARETYAGQRKALEALQEQSLQLTQRLGDDALLSVADLQSRYLQLRQLVEERVREEQAHQQGVEQLQALQQQEQRLRTDLDRTRTALAQTDNQLAVAETALAGAERELPADLREAGVLDAAIKQAQDRCLEQAQQIERIRREYQSAQSGWHQATAMVQGQVEAVAAATTRLQAQESRWNDALLQSEFAGEAAYQQARMSPDARQQERQAIIAFERNLQRSAAIVEEQQQGVAGRQPPDLEALGQTLSLAREQSQNAERQWQALEQQVVSLEQTALRLERVEETLSRLEARYALVGTLSDLTNGQTGDKVSLQRFVLSVLLDDVLVEASHRLSLMSKGRYRLLRKESRTKGNKASGLELEVEDAYTGKVRPVATLSGGESFMAALAMALGLSEVVQAYAGGIRLDTLFIDEGFGSLDSESLDLALRTLSDLQSSGRMVGVISHVAELKEQMPLRLDVIATREGSRVQLITL